MYKFTCFTYLSVRCTEINSLHQKKFKPKVKKTVFIYCKLFDKFISKLTIKTKKTPLWKFEKNFLCKRQVKTIFGLHLPFAINFMFEVKMSFLKILLCILV